MQNATSPFQSPATRFSIGSIDRPELTDVTATYNPKELQYDRNVPWSAHPAKELEYGGTQGRSLTVELLFNGFETGTSVAPQIKLLETLSLPVDADSVRGAERRPHYCIALWGSAGLPRLLCVIESVSTKYTVFSPTGMPLRATCTLKLKEATVLERNTIARRAVKLDKEDAALRTIKVATVAPAWMAPILPKV